VAGAGLRGVQCGVARALCALVLLSGLAVLACAQSPAPSPSGATTADVIRTLARERVLGEDGAGLLKDYAGNDTARLAQGRLLYSDARAEFEALIEQLKADLAEGRDPANTAEFQTALQTAVSRREAFLAYLRRDVLPQVSEEKAGVLAAAAAATELIPALAKGATVLWGEWRKASAEHRAEIERRLDAQKWRAFERIG
jgi:hypothetical protein